jgi:hypothetical protein
MRLHDVSVNQSVPTEANRGLTSYTALAAKRSLCEDAQSTAQRMADVIAFMKQNLTWSQAKREHYANYSQYPAPEYRVSN